MPTDVTPEWIERKKDSVYVLSLTKQVDIWCHTHRDYPGQWVLSCTGWLSGIDRVVLTATILEQAKKEAVLRVLNSINRMRDILVKVNG